MPWTAEPSYDKPDIRVRAATAYYEIAAPILLPFVCNRLLNLFRCRDHRCFYQRNRDHPPTGKEFDGLVPFQRVTQKNGRIEDYLYVRNAEELISCAKLQTVEFHGWGSRSEAIECPDRLVIDLDPDPNLEFARVKNAAARLHDALQALGLKSFAMLSGGKGIHVVVPLEPVAGWNEVESFSRNFCTAIARLDPQEFTVSLPKVKRKGRIFLDFLRNHRTATAILPYSARARTGMAVAAPVEWNELSQIHSSDYFTIADSDELLKRARRHRLSRWGSARQRLPKLR